MFLVKPGTRKILKLNGKPTLVCRCDVKQGIFPLFLKGNKCHACGIKKPTTPVSTIPIAITP